MHHPPPVRKSAIAHVGARGTDSLSAIDKTHALNLKASGIDFCVRYIHSVTPDEVEAILSVGLAFFPVTFATPPYAPPPPGLQLPLGTTVFLDLEGPSLLSTPVPVIQQRVADWAKAVAQAGYQPGLYVGAPQPLTSHELYALPVVRYWHGQGRCVDRTGALAEPTCGWCMTQLYPSVTWGGLWADISFIGQDYKGRLPMWAIDDRAHPTIPAPPDA